MVDILTTLKKFVYADATDYIGLTSKEIKELPADIRQCIQSISCNKKTYKDRSGRAVTDEVIRVTMVDKLQAVEKINKHIGFYSVDNQQKKQSVNIDKLNVNVLNALLDATKKE